MLRLDMLRKEKNLSQNELAKKINMTQQRISAYEKGIREPDIETLKQLADFFQCTIDYLTGKSDIRNPEKINMDDVDVSFLTGVKGLNETNKMIIQNTLEALLTKQEKDEKDNSKKEK